jgi:hypothetical protein
VLLTRLLLATVMAVAVACGGNLEPREHLTATPLANPSPSPSPSPSVSPTPSPSASPTPAEREPTDADRARFAAAYGPEGATGIRHVAVDVDGDDRRELVFAMLLDGKVRVEVAWWQGTDHRVEASVKGAQAKRLTSMAARDINGDGLVELVVTHAADETAGLDVWAVEERGKIGDVRGEGACVSGNSFGDLGARLADIESDGILEIVGTCSRLFGLFEPQEVTWAWDGSKYVLASDVPSPDEDEDD